MTVDATVNDSTPPGDALTVDPHGDALTIDPIVKSIQTPPGDAFTIDPTVKLMPPP